MESQRSPSNRGEIAPFFVMEVMRAAEERELAGDQVLHLEVGQPSTPAPAGVIEAAHRALDEDVLGYTTAAGTPELRARVARHYDEWYGVEVDPDRLMFTVGASGAFVAAFLAAFDVGDRVVVPSPGYPCYRNALEALGCEVVDLPTTLETRFQPTVELLDRVVAAGGPIAGLVLSSPSNPTGTMLDIDRMAQITSWCRANGVWFVSDEIYHGLSYGKPAPTALQFDPDAIVINSFSKYFSMTGWRLGWMLAPERLRRPVDVLTGNFSICPPVLAQHAALAAFDATSYAELDGHVQRYAHNRAVLLEGLPRLGITELAPADGAFYAYADVRHLTRDSMAYARDLLARTGVAVATGIDFDTVDGGRFLRFSFAGATDDIVAALDRLDGAL